MSVASSVRRSTLLLVLGVLSVFALLAALSLRDTARADPPYPPQSGCALSSSGSSSGSVSLTGSGFPAHSTIALHMGSTSLGRVSSNADGAFQTSINVPASAGATNTVSASAGSTSCSLPTSGTAGQTVNRTGGSTSSTSTSASGTASTGFQAITATVIALALLGGGASLVLVARRRKTS